MPLILHHFIKCHWGPCYMSLHKHAIVPHLDDALVLDYVLRTDVVIDCDGTRSGTLVGPGDPEERHQHVAELGGTGTSPKMYDELYHFLGEVESPEIKRYLVETFGDRFGQRSGRFG